FSKVGPAGKLRPPPRALWVRWLDTALDVGWGGCGREAPSIHKSRKPKRCRATVLHIRPPPRPRRACKRKKRRDGVALTPSRAWGTAPRVLFIFFVFLPGSGRGGPSRFGYLAIGNGLFPPVVSGLPLFQAAGRIEGNAPGDVHRLRQTPQLPPRQLANGQF